MDPVSEVQRQLGNLIRIGTVADLDLVSGRCRVRTGEVVTDFLPWLAPRAGDCSEWSVPSVGEQGVVLCPGGDTHGAVFLRGLYSDAMPAPGGGDSLHLVRFPDGAQVRYDHDAHRLQALLPSGGTAEITADGGVTINGPLTVNGDTTHNGDVDVTGTVTADTDVLGGGKSLKNHKHTGIQPGGGVSGPPQ